MCCSDNSLTEAAAGVCANPAGKLEVDRQYEGHFVLAPKKLFEAMETIDHRGVATPGSRKTDWCSAERGVA
jgi:hypothetical protein